MLKAFGIETCAGLIANRGLLAALFSTVSTVNFFMAAGLGIGRAPSMGEPVEEGAIGRKGISNERTFQAMSAPAELEEAEGMCSRLMRRPYLLMKSRSYSGCQGIVSSTVDAYWRMLATSIFLQLLTSGDMQRWLLAACM